MDGREIDAMRIEKQMIRFFVALDEREFDAMAAVLAESGTWLRAGVLIEGRQALLDLMAERPVDRRSRHSLSNCLVAFTGEDSAVLTFYSTAWVHLGAITESFAPMNVPSSISAYRAEYVLQGGVWLMQKLTSKPAFKRAKVAA